jgi:hypothetical protein
MQSCTLVLRRLTPETGITEMSLPIHTLEELYAYCVGEIDPHLIERVLLTGEDAQGRPRLLTFSFQSLGDQVNL